MTEPTVRPGANAESAPLNLRAPHEVIERLTRVASKLPPGLFSKHKLAVIALEHGLAAIERDPSILLRGPASASAAASPEAPVERVERASPAAPAVAPVPVVDTRQGHLPITATVASAATSSESTHAPSEPSAAPKRTRDDDDDALRVRYRAALAAKRLVGTHTATSIGCSEASLRGWAKGDTKTLKSEWLAALAVLLDGLDAKEVPA
jgi:hypothetical protein